MLTDEKPRLLAGGPGLTIDRSEPASASLLRDLRSDVGMEWVPDEMWLTYLQLGADAGDLDYDLAVTAEPGRLPAISDVGVEASHARPVTGGGGAGIALWPAVLAVVAGALVLLLRRSPKAVPA